MNKNKEFAGNIWKFGCTWEKRTNPSYYEFIKDREIVIGRDKYRYSIGDLVLITEGFTVKAIAMVEEEPKPLVENPNLSVLHDKYKVYREIWVNYAKAKWYELPEDEEFIYARQAGGGRVNQPKTRERAIELWNNRNSKS